MIVWSTGYGNPLTESLAGKAEIIVIGKNGKEMEELNKSMDLKSLHGCTTYGFPNLFHLALSQAGVGVNQVQRIEAQSIHIAYIIAQAEKQGGKVIEADEAACDKWGDEIAGTAHLTAAMLACTPGYFTLEGDAANIPQEVLGKMARNGLYGQGFLKYNKKLGDWRANGDLEGIRIASAA